MQPIAEPGRPLALSPSVNHAYLRMNQEPALAFTGGPVPEWQEPLRGRLRDLVGLPDLPRPPLDVRVLWRDTDLLGTIEKIAFTCEPYADAVAYFCVPHGLTPPYPTVICLQGHNTGMHVSIGRDRRNETDPITPEGDRDFALGAMRNGFAALCIEQRSFGERSERVQVKVANHGCHDAVMHALMLGRTLVGERVFDVDRGIDYLTERGDVDLNRVGVMGNSGGGTATMYAAALLPRVRFAVPSCAFCTFAASIMNIYHCGDNYVPGILRYAEAADVMGLFAPKPVVVVAGRDDDIFPIAGVRTAFEGLREIYTAAGASDRCRLVIGDGGHRFYAEQAWSELLSLLADES